MGFWFLNRIYIYVHVDICTYYRTIIYIHQDSESQMFDGRLSYVDIQEQLAEAKAQHDTSRAPPTFALSPPNYGGVQRSPTVPSQPYSPQSRHRQPAAMQNTGDEHHHRHYPTGRRHTAAEKQQLVDQVPDWLKTDNVVGVKIPGVREPMTGTVKFVGVLQVKGFDQLCAGVQLVSFKLVMQHALKLAAFTVFVTIIF